MALLRRLVVLAGAAEAARRYARSHPEQASKYIDQAAQFVDKQTKGRYSTQITGLAQKTKSAAGIPRPTPGPAANGQVTTDPLTP